MKLKVSVRWFLTNPVKICIPTTMQQSLFYILPNMPITVGITVLSPPSPLDHSVRFYIVHCTLYIAHCTFNNLHNCDTQCFVTPRSSHVLNLCMFSSMFRVFCSFLLSWNLSEPWFLTNQVKICDILLNSTCHSHSVRFYIIHCTLYILQYTSILIVIAI